MVASDLIRVKGGNPKARCTFPNSQFKKGYLFICMLLCVGLLHGILINNIKVYDCNIIKCEKVLKCTNTLARLCICHRDSFPNNANSQHQPPKVFILVSFSSLPPPLTSVPSPHCKEGRVHRITTKGGWEAPWRENHVAGDNRRPETDSGDSDRSWTGGEGNNEQ